MIGPIILKGELVEGFRSHLLNFPYFHVINDGTIQLGNSAKDFTKDEADSITRNFINSSFPIICLAGSKSAIPFFDYHIALKYASNKNEVIVNELLVREPKHENAIKAIIMAYYVLINRGIEKLGVPYELSGFGDYEDILVEKVPNENITYLSRKH